MKFQKQKIFIRLFLLLIMALAFANLSSSEASGAEYSETSAVRVIVGLNVSFQPEGYLTGQETVMNQRRQIAAAQSSLLNALPASSIHDIVQFKYIPYVALEIDDRDLVALNNNPLVASIVEDKAKSAALDDTIPLIHADLAHLNGYDGAGFTVAVLDTGVDTGHLFLAGKTVSEACYSTTSGNNTTVCPNGMDVQVGAGAGINCPLNITGCDHGTHVAGIAVGLEDPGNGININGVANEANLIAIQVFHRVDDVPGDTPCSDNGLASPCALYFSSDLIQGLERVYDLRNTFDIAAANMSLGGALYDNTADCDSDNAGTKAAMDNLLSADIASVVASGNDGEDDMISAPACISTAISVGNTTKTDTVNNSSNSASFLDLLAPGTSITSSVPGTLGVKSGTSMAAPHVAGAWAVVLSKFPTNTVAQTLTFLQNTGVPITDPRNNITTSRIDLEGLMPTADAGGPYFVLEGDLVVLNGSGSDPDGDPITFAWDFDEDNVYDDAFGPNPTYNLTGQDGVFTIGLQVTDINGDFNTDDTTVTVSNVAPNVTLDPAVPADENSPITVSGEVSDPGWLDPLSATIDWGDGTPVENITGVLENDPPNATLTFSIDHVYGDNGPFAALVCGFDDDTSTCQKINLQVDNVNPTAAIDLSSAILINGIPTILGTAGEPVDFSANSTDPGSDDLILNWDWDDGTPVESSTSQVNDPIPDPFPSPSIQPRDVDVDTAHTFADACLYQISFWAEDDDGGVSDVQMAYVLIVGTADRARHAGYWQHQYSGNGRIDFEEATLQCYLDITGFVSNVFNEETDASTIPAAHDVLFMGQNGGDARQRLDRQLLTVWLNFANGSMGYLELFDTGHDGVPDTSLADIMANAESVRLDPTSSNGELRRQAQLLIRIINRANQQ